MNINSQPELLPCPFCGCETRIEANIGVIGHENWCFLAHLSIAYVPTSLFANWNTRHTPQPSAESGMKSAEEWTDKLVIDNRTADALRPWVKQIQQDAFAAGVRSTKEKGR